MTNEQLAAFIKQGGNGSGQCNVGGNITDDYMHRGCWAGTLLPELLENAKKENHNGKV